MERSNSRPTLPVAELERMPVGVHRLSVPYPGGYVNSYVVLCADGARLIDTGHHSEPSRNELRRRLRDFGVSPREIRQILLTHAHPDHIGLTAELASGGAEILIHTDEVDQDGHLPDRFEEGVLREHGLDADLPMPPDERGPLPGAVTRLRGDEHLDFGPLRLQLIATPGHSPGLLCAYEPKGRWLLSTDQLLRVPTPLYIMDRSPADPFQRYQEGLARLRGLDVEIVLPGHGRAFGNLERHLDAARDAQLKRLDDVHAGMPAEGSTAHELCRKLGWSSQIAASRHRYADAFALGRLLAYLRRLEITGRARYRNGRWSPSKSRAAWPETPP
jgi:glyoxylase-like metal-dependent hydrolase (beta-lactamase superfamily II)